MKCKVCKKDIVGKNFTKTYVDGQEYFYHTPCFDKEQKKEKKLKK